ncbi:MAG: hypothetical protein OHK0011_25440 [Turneriella sp.]
MRAKWYVVAGLVVLSLALLLFFPFARGGGSFRPSAYTRMITRGGGEGFATPAELERLLNRDPSPRAVLEAYRAYAQYPDFSRPLDKTMVDLTDPWRISDEPLPLIDDPRVRNESALRARIEELKAAGKSDEEISKDLQKYYEGLPRYQFSANRHTLTPGDELVVTLRVFDAGGAKLEYTVTDAVIMGDPMMTRSVLGSPEYNDSGFSPDAVAGDGTTTFSWKIPGEDRKYWGNLKLNVGLRVRGTKEPVVVSHGFYGSPLSPAFFTGQFHERLENGSLVIDAFLDVKRECKFVLQANLYSARGEPTHWATVNTVLEPGIHAVPFVFFGKIFHDMGIDGRFTVRDLRGTCENLPFPARWLNDPARIDAVVNAKPLEEPLLYYIPYTSLTYTTQREYTFKDFSNTEWNSPEKEARLRQLEDAAQNER